MIKDLIFRFLPRTLVAATALMVMVAASLQAQGWITLGTNDASIRRVSPSSSVALTVKLDMSTRTAGSEVRFLASRLDWDPASLTFDSLTAGDFGTLGNIEIFQSAGHMAFTALAPAPVAVTRNVAIAYFTSGAAPGGSRLRFTPTQASSGGVNVPSGELVGWTQDICVALPGVWGDVNADAQVDIIDAQQVARASVGATVTDSVRLANNGDVNGDGEVDILDAQSLARHAVQLSAPARIEQPRSVPPVAATLTMSQTLTLPLGTTTALLATPFDADGNSVVGCASATWATSDAGVVRVNETGWVTSVSAGSATVTATSGAAPPAQVVVTVPP